MEGKQTSLTFSAKQFLSVKVTLLGCLHPSASPPSSRPSWGRAENGHIPLLREKQDVELNKATETAFLNCPCQSVCSPGPEALPANAVLTVLFGLDVVPGGGNRVGWGAEAPRPEPSGTVLRNTALYPARIPATEDTQDPRPLTCSPGHPTINPEKRGGVHPQETRS